MEQKVRIGNTDEEIRRCACRVSYDDLGNIVISGLITAMEEGVMTSFNTVVRAAFTKGLEEDPMMDLGLLYWEVVKEVCRLQNAGLVTVTQFEFDPGEYRKWKLDRAVKAATVLDALSTMRMFYPVEKVMEMYGNQIRDMMGDISDMEIVEDLVAERRTADIQCSHYECVRISAGHMWQNRASGIVSGESLALCTYYMFDDRKISAIRDHQAVLGDIRIIRLKKPAGRTKTETHKKEESGMKKNDNLEKVNRRNAETRQRNMMKALALISKTGDPETAYAQICADYGMVMGANGLKTEKEKMGNAEKRFKNWNKDTAYAEFVTRRTCRVTQAGLGTLCRYDKENLDPDWEMFLKAEGIDRSVWKDACSTPGAPENHMEDVAEDVAETINEKTEETVQEEIEMKTEETGETRFDRELEGLAKIEELVGKLKPMEDGIGLFDVQRLGANMAVLQMIANTAKEYGIDIADYAGLLKERMDKAVGIMQSAAGTCTDAKESLLAGINGRRKEVSDILQKEKEEAEARAKAEAEAEAAKAAAMQKLFDQIEENNKAMEMLKRNNDALMAEFLKLNPDLRKGGDQ